ncbi:MAG: hypothetical protein GX289_07605 [Tissierellia bacterium]|nr:hypothetical protein [Tissierellia bacterium]
MEKFNIFGSMKKKWLPPSYGKNKHENMSEEERAVIDEFQGKGSYEKVLNNVDKYIINITGLLMLKDPPKK